MSTYMFFLHWTPSSRYCRIYHLNFLHLNHIRVIQVLRNSQYLVCPLYLSRQISNVIFGIFSFKSSRMVRPCSFLFGYFSSSSTSSLKFKWLSACFRGSSPWQTERILHLLTPTFLCLMQQPATSLQIMSLSEGDTLVFSSNSTVSLRVLAIQSHHAYSTKSTPQFLIGSRYVVLNDKTIHLLRGSVGFIPLRMIHMIQYDSCTYHLHTYPRRNQHWSAWSCLRLLHSLFDLPLSTLSFTKATGQTIHCCNALALLTYLIFFYLNNDATSPRLS